MNHDRIEELLAVRALGGLDAADTASLEGEMAVHGTCAECRRLQRGFVETAGRLAVSLEPVAVDPGMVDRILASGRTVDSIAPARSDEPTRGAPRDELAERRRSRGTFTFVGVAAGIALVAVVAVTALRPGRRTDVAVQPAQTVVRFQGDDGQLAMAYTPGASGVIFWGSDLPDPGADRVYEIWMIQDGTPVSGGCLRPTATGDVAVFVDANVGTTDLMAVTVEPADCPAAPTGDPVLTAPLDVT